MTIDMSTTSGDRTSVSSRLSCNALNDSMQAMSTNKRIFHAINRDAQEPIHKSCVPVKSNNLELHPAHSNHVQISPSTSVISFSPEYTEKLDKINLDPHRTKAKSNEKSMKTLRRGKWTIEEEEYVARIIKSFNSGYLDATAGTTLRAYLSEKLQCDPMRITKKFTGEACIGKRIFNPAVRCPENSDAIDKDQAAVRALEVRWRERVDSVNRESTRRALSSNSITDSLIHKQRNSATSDHDNFTASYTASWLDSATGFLSTHPPQEAEMSVIPVSEVEDQLNTVKKLIDEAPNLRTLVRRTKPLSKPSLQFQNSQHVQIRRQERRLNNQTTSTTFMKEQEFGSDMFHQIGSNVSSNDVPSPPHKKPRKARSTNHLSSMLLTTTNSRHLNNHFPINSTTNIKDAEILMDFMRSARQNCNAKKRVVKQRSYSLT